MRKKHGSLVVLATLISLLSLTGCGGGRHHRKNNNDALVIGEPGLGGVTIPAGADDPTMVPGNPPRKVAWYDRHPLTRKPKEVYENTDKGVVVKGAAATFIGVPMGILGEARQIIVGCPPGF